MSVVLRHHPHKHLPLLEVAADLLEARFAAGCDTMRCKGTCCADGTTVDVTERDRILAHADVVRASMVPGMDPDPAHWFEPREAEDLDFASGVAAYTMADEKGCVFLDPDRRCVLQRASETSGGALRLKPFYCFAFPVVIDHGVLGVDPLAADTGSPACCAPDASGPRTIFDVCGMELEHVVGAEGVAELRRLAGDGGA